MRHINFGSADCLKKSKPPVTKARRQLRGKVPSVHPAFTHTAPPRHPSSHNLGNVHCPPRDPARITAGPRPEATSSFSFGTMKSSARVAWFFPLLNLRSGFPVSQPFGYTSY